MSNYDTFKPEVAERLGEYVYRLIDPRNGETFYVGRGSDNRVFHHALASPEFREGDDKIMPARLEQIKDIHNAGLKVIHVIHRHGIPPHSVAEVEAALIDAYPGLKNIQGGYGSSDRGPMSPRELIRKYGLPEFPIKPEHKLILININRFEGLTNPEGILKQVRGWWRLSLDRAKRAEYVVAVVRGVAIGVFKPAEWKEARDDGSSSRRFGFEGRL
jgi:hypothetical protein